MYGDTISVILHLTYKISAPVNYLS